MPNKATVIIKDIEVGAEKLLSFVTNAESKVNAAGPGAVAGLATLLGAVGSAIAEAGEAASAGGVNIALDVETFNSLKTVWPDIESFASKIGIKL